MPDNWTHKVEGSNCTACGALCDAASGVSTSQPPEPGDCTVCLMCGHIMVYGDQLRLRNPTDAEMHEIAGNMDIITIQKARQMVFKGTDRE